MYALTSKPYYNTYTQCYENIIMINMLPEGPLRKLVRRINIPILSKTYTNLYNNNRCGLVLTKIIINNCNCNYSNSYTKNNLMNPNDIPDLFSFLTANGYVINTQVTNMMNMGDVKLTNSNLICYFSYNK